MFTLQIPLIFIIMSIKKIIKEEINDFDWASNVVYRFFEIAVCDEYDDDGQECIDASSYWIKTTNLKSDNYVDEVIELALEGGVIRKGDVYNINHVDEEDFETYCLNYGMWGDDIDFCRGLVKEEINDFDWISDIEPMEPGMEFLKDNFDNLEKVIKDNKTYYVDSERKHLFMYHQDGENGVVWVNFNRVWSILRDDFGLNYNEIQELIKVWLDETYNLRGLTPMNTISMHL